MKKLIGMNFISLRMGCKFLVTQTQALSWILLWDLFILYDNVIKEGIFEDKRKFRKDPSISATLVTFCVEVECNYIKLVMVIYISMAF